MEDRQRPGAGARMFALAGGLAFVGSLLYFVYAYFQRFGPAAPPVPTEHTRPIVVNLALFTAFALHHSAFARTGLKDWVARSVSPHVERSVYVWISSALFVAVCAAWQPVPGFLWSAPDSLRPALYALQIVGGILAVRSAGRLDVLDLAGIRQVLGGERAAPDLLQSGPYGVVRHPVYLGWLLLVWATPVMTGTRLVFAAVSTLYLALAVPMEERDLIRVFGPQYEDYKRTVRWRMIPFVF
jgi:protein-S-isoprenylcysteine O-methyltransferase Ste14